jgi:hypothetical protein
MILSAAAKAALIPTMAARSMEANTADVVRRVGGRPAEPEARRHRARGSGAGDRRATRTSRTSSGAPKATTPTTCRRRSPPTRRVGAREPGLGIRISPSGSSTSGRSSSAHASSPSSGSASATGPTRTEHRRAQDGSSSDSTTSSASTTRPRSSAIPPALPARSSRNSRSSASRSPSSRSREHAQACGKLYDAVDQADRSPPRHLRARRRAPRRDEADARQDVWRGIDALPTPTSRRSSP